jgi:hypothetical protein
VVIGMPVSERANRHGDSAFEIYGISLGQEIGIVRRLLSLPWYAKDVTAKARVV